MKHRLLIMFIACAAMAGSTPNVARAEVGVGVGVSANVDIQVNSPADFDQPLDPYGTWVDVGSYGRCWRPKEMATDWQPYTIGHWEWTDTGWYWASDEPWGWACYHYGSWYEAPNYGWVWIPGTEWAPAWVTWRYSDDYIGWAPCGPGHAVLAASFFTFCDVHHFQDHFRSRRDFVVNNTTIINRTKVVNNFSRKTVNIGGHDRTVFENRGPGIDPIRRATGHEVTPRPVHDVIQESRSSGNTRRDNNQPRELRQDQRPNEQPRRDNVPDQQRRDQVKPNELPATGRNDAHPARPERRDATPTRPQQEPPKATPPAEQHTLPPTGRDDARPAQPEHRDVTPVRPPREVPRVTPPAQQRREVPTPPQNPIAPAERPLAPTGREVVRPPTPAPAERPAIRPEPGRPAAPVTHDGGDDHRDRQ